MADTAADSVLRVGRLVILMLPCVKSYFGKMSSSNFRRMVKDRLGLPKDQTIVFNVHRFATN